MSNKILLAVALVALSVSKLEKELTASTYPADTLNEALELEKAKPEPRSTAIAAIEAALAPAGLKVPAGKAMLTLAGIKEGGEVVTAAMVTGGDDQLALLKEKGLLV
jgi:hypothetical protein